jgi:hypothetical protein
MPCATLRANHVNRSSVPCKAESQTTLSSRVICILLQDFAIQQNGLQLGYGYSVRDAFIICVKRQLVALTLDFGPNEVLCETHIVSFNTRYTVVSSAPFIQPSASTQAG